MSKPLIFVKYSKNPKYLMDFMSQVYNKIFKRDETEYLIAVSGGWRGNLWRMEFIAYPQRIPTTSSLSIFPLRDIDGELIRFKLYETLTDQQIKTLGQPIQ